MRIGGSSTLSGAQDGYSTIGSTGGGQKSSMIEQEMKAIQRIKEKQKKEVEQMIDLEMKMNAIKRRNEEKARLQAEKEAR